MKMKFRGGIGKKALAFALSLVIILTATAVPVFALTDENSSLKYEEDYNGEIIITGYNGYKNDLTEIVIPSEIDGKKVVSVDESAFSGFSNLESVTLPEGIEDIYPEAFFDCTSLKEISVPKSVDYIGENAFGFYWDDEFDAYVAIDNFTINGYEYSAAYNYADEFGFKFNSLGEGSPWRTDDFDNGTLCIEDYIGDKDNLTEVTIPAELDGKKVAAIMGGVFQNCPNLENVTIPDTITYIDWNAFESCPNLKNVSIPASVYFIRPRAFGYYFEGYDDDYHSIYGKVEGFKISGYTNSGADRYARENDIEFESLGEISPFNCVEKNDGTLEIARYNGEDTDVDIVSELDGKTVTDIAYAAFADCTQLKSVSIPKSVSSIGNLAFENCESLESVEMEEGVGIIGDRAFYDCKKLNDVTVPESVTSIGVYALGYYAEELLDDAGYIYMENRKIDGFVINGFTGTAAQSYAKENGFEFNALAEGRYFTTEELDDGTVEITGYTGIVDNLSIPSLINGKKVSSIGAYAFMNDTELKDVTIAEGISSIGALAFSGCLSLEKITLPDGLTYLAEDALFDCPMLKSVTIPGNPKAEYKGSGVLGYETDGDDIKKVEGFTIYANKFSYYHQLAIEGELNFVSIGEVSPWCYTELDDGTLEINEMSRTGDEQSIDIPSEIDGKTVTKISGLNCEYLRSVYIPKTVTSIDFQAVGYIHSGGIHEMIKGFIIRGEMGSEAAFYAFENRIPFFEKDEPIINGDINGDGSIDMKDVGRLLQYVCEMDVNFVGSTDVNVDGSTDMKDVGRLLQYVCEMDVTIY